MGEGFPAVAIRPLSLRAVACNAGKCTMRSVCGIVRRRKTIGQTQKSMSPHAGATRAVPTTISSGVCAYPVFIHTQKKDERQWK